MAADSRSAGNVCILFLILFRLPNALCSLEEGKETDDASATVFEALQWVDGQSNIQSMLHWAIGNSDPAVLRAKAEAEIETRLSREEQQERVRELSDVMSQQVTEGDLMKESIFILKNTSSSHKQIISALDSLKILVERIDNANDLKTMGGIQCLLGKLEDDTEYASLAAAVIGVAASNNPKFQGHLYAIDPEIVSKFVEMMNSTDIHLKSNALYAVSSLIRNSETLRTLFYASGGLNAVHRILESSGVLRLKKKCLTLLADLMELGRLSITDRRLIELIADMINENDWDVMEKAMATLTLVLSQSDDVFLLRDASMESTLRQRRRYLQRQAEAAEDGGEYVQEMLLSIDALLRRWQRSEEHTEL